MCDVILSGDDILFRRWQESLRDFGTVRAEYEIATFMSCIQLLQHTALRETSRSVKLEETIFYGIKWTFSAV